MVSTDVSNRIKEIIKEHSDKKDLNDLENVQLNSVLDSLQFVKVIVSLEDEYDIEIEDKYLVPANLNSLAAMTQLILDITGGEK
ncbi:acyl carrier protein [Ruminiclostridium josui]|uniref:acyl carrier protein n=1 Tax=Ruminiclostridium josui TaxID=1499 RepID=UPI0004649AA4|nr:acyl carrier protein [Ruminiclostridium josui]